MVVILGVGPVKGRRRNPFDFYTREEVGWFSVGELKSMVANGKMPKSTKY